MRHDHTCQHLPHGTTIEDQRDVLWTKIYDDTWASEDGCLRLTDRMMDQEVARGRAQQIIVDKGLMLQPIPSYDLEEGDYVVMTWGFWWDGEPPPLYDPEKSQLLFRVAGWLNSDGDDNWIVMLDAPEATLHAIGWSEFQDEYNAYNDIAPVCLYVGPETVFHYVEKGQQHQTWDSDYDWSFQYTLMGPPEEPAA